MNKIKYTYFTTSEGENVTKISSPSGLIKCESDKQESDTFLIEWYGGSLFVYHNTKLKYFIDSIGLNRSYDIMNYKLEHSHNNLCPIRQQNPFPKEVSAITKYLFNKYKPSINKEYPEINNRIKKLCQEYAELLVKTGTTISEL